MNVLCAQGAKLDIVGTISLGFVSDNVLLFVCYCLLNFETSF